MFDSKELYKDWKAGQDHQTETPNLKPLIAPRDSWNTDPKNMKQQIARTTIMYDYAITQDDGRKKLQAALVIDISRIRT